MKLIILFVPAPFADHPIRLFLPLRRADLRGQEQWADPGLALDLLETAESSVEYRSEMALELKGLGCSIEKTRPDGRLKIAGVSREAIDAS